MTRLCLNDIRSRKRERRVIVPLPGAGSQDRGEDFLDGIADRKDERGEIALERSELAGAIRSAIEDLPPAQRAAVLLLRFEELSYREIAEAMGLSVMAVKSLLHRGREGLRERLARYLDLPPEEQGGREPEEKRKEDRRHAR